MHKLAESRLLAGFIYGDSRNQEYIYLPGSELDAASPMLIYEIEGRLSDVTMEEALDIIEKRSLKPAVHPRLGKIPSARNKKLRTPEGIRSFSCTKKIFKKEKHRQRK